MKRIRRLFPVLLAFCLILPLPMEVLSAGKPASSFQLTLTYPSKTVKRTLKKLQRLIKRQSMAALKKEVTAYINTSCPSPDKWSVYVKNLKTGYSFTINNRSYYPASTIKLFGMGAAYDKIKKRKLTDSPSLEQKIHNMIAYSDNDSFNSLAADIVGVSYINDFCKRYGFKRTNLIHGTGPGSHAFIYHDSSTGYNSTSARDCGVFLEKIYKGTMVSKAYSRQMLNHLLAQNHRSKIPAGIPSGIRVANKTGEAETVENDTAIVYGKKVPYVICIFSETSKAPGTIPCMQTISRLVYHALND